MTHWENHHSPLLPPLFFFSYVLWFFSQVLIPNMCMKEGSPTWKLFQLKMHTFFLLLMITQPEKLKNRKANFEQLFLVETGSSHPLNCNGAGSHDSKEWLDFIWKIWSGTDVLSFCSSFGFFLDQIVWMCYFRNQFSVPYLELTREKKS